MKRSPVLAVVGVIVAVVGVVWTLQGLGLLAGSPMTGVRTWAIIGPIVAVIGVVLLVAGLRRHRER
ncbi:hypothetical protein [Georgenia thermotolerans]|uniref:hypothetical protein n=1 Tax=Georgenia thermotolerans TaxID=527326 RepID=UPI001263FBAA|nr:hypothetical protein [Georgenia thermotolerans]